MAHQRQVKFKNTYNSRNMREISVCGMHLSIPELTEQMNEADRNGEPKDMLKYLNKDQAGKIPNYPHPVEFVVSDLTHVTDEIGCDMILESKQFRAPKSNFSWWSLYIDKEEINSAERRYLERNAANGEQQPNNPEPFLNKFTTSPPFLSQSRYGNYRFRFPLAEVIEQYKIHNCEEMEPVFRVFKTATYKQEIMYAVLVHSPEDDELFENLPLLEESEWVSYQNGQITWKAQAICETHWYSISPELEAESVAQGSQQYFVWDHVCLAFYMPRETSWALKFTKNKLIDALSACELGDIDLRHTKKGEDKKVLYNKALIKVKELKKDLGS